MFAKKWFADPQLVIAAYSGTFGETGLPGPTGAQGTTGAVAGATGAQGITGLEGAVGATGSLPAGGVASATFYTMDGDGDTGAITVTDGIITEIA